MPWSHVLLMATLAGVFAVLVGGWAWLRSYANKLPVSDSRPRRPSETSESFEFFERSDGGNIVPLRKD